MATEHPPEPTTRLIFPIQMNCTKHCWCVYEPEDYPQWFSIIRAMRATLHEHGDSTTCASCAYEDGRLTIQ